MTIKEEIYIEALGKIACWGDGDEVTAHFDDPASASTAREALAAAVKIARVENCVEDIEATIKRVGLDRDTTSGVLREVAKRVEVAVKSEPVTEVEALRTVITVAIRDLRAPGQHTLGPSRDSIADTLEQALCDNALDGEREQAERESAEDSLRGRPL